MKYMGMPLGMWMLFRKSFETNLTAVFGLEGATAKTVMAQAKGKYQQILGKLPESEQGDRFQSNIVSCAMLAAVVLSMSERPDVKRLTVYYRQSMMTAPMRWFCRRSGKGKFTQRDMESMRKTSAFRAADRNPYSWNMEFLPYDDGSGYEVRFTKCGICTRMRELDLFDLVPAICALDYTMSESGGAAQFVRKCTLANGDSYCDCGYKRKEIPS